MFTLLQCRPAGGGGGGVTDHAALTSLDYASAAHTDFLSLGTAQTVTAEKIIDSAVGFRLGHAAGPLLQGPASGDDLALTGDLAISGLLGIPTVTALRGLYVNKTFTTGTLGAAIEARSYGTSPSPIGVYGGASYIGSSANKVARGLDFAASSNTTVNMNGVQGINVVAAILSSGNVTSLYGIILATDYTGAGRATTARGIYIGNFGVSGGGTAYGLHVLDQSGATYNYIIEAGPSTPYLRLVGGAAPAANCTNLWLAEGVTPTLRNVQWKLYSALVAGDMVAVLV